MMKTIRVHFLLFALLFLFGGCEPDLEVNAPWEDIAIIYGLLDKNDSIHYVRIHKAYLNENQDARIIAGNPDSIYYDDKLTVLLEEYADNVKANQWELRKDTLYNKEDGVFASPINILYRTPDNFPELNDQHIYRIFLKHGETGETFSAQTPVVGQLELENPRHVLYIGNIPAIEIRWLSGVNTYFYDLQMLFHYTEIDKKTQDSTFHTLEWQLFRFRRTNTTARTDQNHTLISEQFFRFIGNQLEADNGVTRRATGAELVFAAGGEEIYTYLRVNQPSSSIVQKESDYTNINNGRGIFSSRTVNQYSFELSPETVDSLADGEFTDDLNFIR